MTAREKFNNLFNNKKCILGMLHLKGDTEEEILDRAARETAIYAESGITAVVVENYFHQDETKYVEKVLDFLQKKCGDMIYGVNLLEHDQQAFEVAAKYGAKFIQLDSVAGHLLPDDDVKFGETIAQWRKTTDALVFGGVRFKYQPYLSGRSLEEDLHIGMERCDGIVVTGTGTGLETSMDKIREFRSLVGDFPLLVGAGVTPENGLDKLEIVDGAVVGSYFKDNYKDNGEVDLAHIKTLLSALKV